MAEGTAYRVLFLGAGPQMQCGVGQFTRLLQEAIEKDDPGSCAALTLTRAHGSLRDIWRGEGYPKNIVLLDNDFFGQPKPAWRALLDEARVGGFR